MVVRGIGDGRRPNRRGVACHGLQKIGLLCRRRPRKNCVKAAWAGFCPRMQSKSSGNSILERNSPKARWLNCAQLTWGSRKAPKPERQKVGHCSDIQYPNLQGKNSGCPGWEGLHPQLPELG